jgi:hypothetical protein
MKPLKKLLTILLFLLAVTTGMFVLTAFIIGILRLFSWL